MLFVSFQVDRRQNGRGFKKDGSYRDGKGGEGVQTLKIPHPNQALLSFASILGEYSTVHSRLDFFFFF